MGAAQDLSTASHVSCRSYNGDRSPFGIYIHTPWLMTGNNIEETNAFLTYALALPDVWMVTTSQLIKWMKVSCCWVVGAALEACAPRLYLLPTAACSTCS